MKNKDKGEVVKRIFGPKRELLTGKTKKIG
jgi:hypothetical protein